MRNALKMAAWIFCACLPLVLGTGPAAAQQQPSTPPQPATAQPPAAQPTDSQSTPAQTPPPAPPPVAIVSGDTFYAGDGISITLRYSYLSGRPVMGTGQGDANAYPSSLNFGGYPRPSGEGIVSIPIGKHNALRFSFFRILGTGNAVAPVDTTIYNTTWAGGTYLATHYNLENAKLSLDFLSWPFPVKDSKFHIKTLWEVQYTTILSSVDAPLEHGLTDAAGDPVVTSGYGKDWFIYPSLGLGIDYLISKKLRFEARGSGFAIPHHSTLYDTEVSLNYRWGALELQAGAKDFHFKTSPLHVEYVAGSYPGIFLGVRWYPEYGKH
ncbi:MAG: hypothetical protein ABSH50_23780 [Bryobacteraceae bacterium]|jgi:hypothetical protein